MFFFFFRIVFLNLFYFHEVLFFNLDLFSLSCLHQRLFYLLFSFCHLFQVLSPFLSFLLIPVFILCPHDFLNFFCLIYTTIPPLPIFSPLRYFPHYLYPFFSPYFLPYLFTLPSTYLHTSYAFSSPSFLPP